MDIVISNTNITIEKKINFNQINHWIDGTDFPKYMKYITTMLRQNI